MKKNVILVLISILVITIINWKFPMLRFTNHFANDFFSLIVISIPFILCIVSIIKLNEVKSKIISISSTVVLTPFCLLFLFVFFFKAISLPPINNELDGGFEKLYQINDEIAAYRTNGGATTAYGIEVRQEKKIFPGIIAIKRLFYRYRMEDISYKEIDNRLILSDVQSQEILKEIEIKPFIYF